MAKVEHPPFIISYSAVTRLVRITFENGAVVELPLVVAVKLGIELSAIMRPVYEVAA